MISFTICSSNFLGYAEALRASIRKFHPAAKFYVILCDSAEAIDRYAFPFPIISLDDLDIPGSDTMRERYNITELNTSLKPFAFLHLFEKHPGESVLYFDPDIMLFSPLHEIEAAFDDGAECVLTPHITEPSEYADMNDYKFILYGTFNLGFCGFRDTALTRRIVAWWGRKLQTDCVIDLSRGIFVDQKWADYFPSFIEKTNVLRHPGYNVAYWNLSQRKLSRSDAGWLVNNQPLRFFHFSGNRIEDTTVFSRHNGQYNIHNTTGLSDILSEYRDSVLSHGHKYFSQTQYSFNWNGASGHNEHTPEDLIRHSDEAVKPYLPVLRSASIGDFREQREFNALSVIKRQQIQCDAVQGNEPFLCEGYCTVCSKESKFQVSQMYSSVRFADGRVNPNWREHLNCLQCGIVNRTRGALHILDQCFLPKPDARVYITERVTPLYTLLQDRFGDLVGSEFFSPKLASGSYKDGVRHEDVQNLSFDDNSFDLVLSFDVLEHVPYIDKAFKEIFRCLAPGGRLLFTVPFSYDHEEAVVRATMDKRGRIKHLLEPEYHGNPVDHEGGSLCFRYFGWSVVNDMRAIGYCNPEIISYWSSELLHYGDPQFVITATKPKT